MKLNNKGFAITIVLYGTFILFLLLIISMLGILSTHKLRLEKLCDETNGTRDIIDTLPVTPELLTCTITGTKADGAESIDESYFTEMLLTVTANKSGATYSFDGNTYNGTNTKTIRQTGTITAYVKIGTEEANCQITIGSRTEYCKSTCSSYAYKYTQVYSCQGSESSRKIYDTKSICNSSCATRQSSCGSTDFSCSCTEFKSSCESWRTCSGWSDKAYSVDGLNTKSGNRTTYTVIS